MAEHELPKLRMRVRFPSSAPTPAARPSSDALHLSVALRRASRLISHVAHTGQVSADGPTSAAVEPPPDVLQLGRRGPSRRTVLLLTVPLVLVLLAGVLADQRARAAETTRLNTCATRTHHAVDDATARVSGILAYVRPVWPYRLPRHVQRSLDGMVSEAAVGTDRPLAGVRRSCAAVDILPLHAALRQRRAQCLQLLDTFIGFLRGIAQDGSRAAGEWPIDVVGAGC